MENECYFILMHQQASNSLFKNMNQASVGGKEAWELGPAKQERVSPGELGAKPQGYILYCQPIVRDNVVDRTGPLNRSSSASPFSSPLVKSNVGCNTWTMCQYRRVQFCCRLMKMNI